MRLVVLDVAQDESGIRLFNAVYYPGGTGLEGNSDPVSFAVIGYLPGLGYAVRLVTIPLRLIPYDFAFLIKMHLARNRQAVVGKGQRGRVIIYR